MINQGNKSTKYILQNRRKTLSILVIVILIPIFQNCSGGGFQSSSGLIQASSTAAAGSNSNSTDDIMNDVTSSPAPGDSGTGNTTNFLPKLQAECKALTEKPIITTIPNETAKIVSSIGDNGLGNVNSSTFSLIADRGIKNLTEFTNKGCESQFELNLTCSVMTADVQNYPLKILSAIDASGANAIGVQTNAAIAGASLTANNCNVAFDKTSNKVNFSIRPNTAGAVRCVEATYWVKLVVRSVVNGITGSYDSDPKYFPVQVANGCWNETKLLDVNGSLPGVINFGTAVAISDTWAAVLAPTEDASSSVLDVGAVYMYMKSGSSWIQKQKIMINDSTSYESLQSVVMNGDTLVIGSPLRNKKGMVYFFRRSGESWSLIQQVDPQESQLDQFFGQAVAISDQYVYVGAPSYKSGALSKAGAVSVYSYNNSGMNYLKTIVGEVANQAFGASLSADGSTVAIGAPQAIGKESGGAGSVYVYKNVNGEVSLLTKKTGTSVGEKFGLALALQGEKLLVGSPNYLVTDKSGAGRVTYFSNYASATATKVWDGGEALGNFGQGVAISKNGLYLGAPLANTRKGFVDFYKLDALDKPYYRIISYNQQPNSAFGWAIAANNSSDVVVGARIRNDPNDNSGAAYIYQFK